MGSIGRQGWCWRRGMGRGKDEGRMMKAVPGLKKMKNKIASKEEKTDKEPETVEKGEAL